MSGRSQWESYVAIKGYEGVDEDGRAFDFKPGVSIISGSWSTLAKQPELMRYLAPSDSRMGLRARNEAVAIQRSNLDKPRDYLAPDDSDRKSWYLPAGSTVTVEHEIPELRRSATPNITVSLRESVWKDLVRHASEARDGRETGGFFFGERVRSHRPARVDRVTRMVTDRAESQCRLDIAALVGEKRTLRASGADHVVEQGSWHTHPDRSGLPSDQDLANWLNALDVLHALDVLRSADYYVGLILTADPGNGSWFRPKVHGWVVRRADHSARTPICEPAIVQTGSA